MASRKSHQESPSGSDLSLYEPPEKLTLYTVMKITIVHRYEKLTLYIVMKN